MNAAELIPAFDWHRVFVAPWSEDFAGQIWIVLMGLLVTTSCGLIGNYLILRRMALVGDAISHSVLPGIAIAFLLTHSRGGTAMFGGALVAALVTTVLIEVIHKKTRVKQDAAIGIVFTSLFAIGVVLISVYADKVDLDQECVLYGEIGTVSLEPLVTWAGREIAPAPVLRMGIVFVITVLLIVCFYKELLVSSFDPGLAVSVGISATLVHFGLMGWLSVVVVSAFESVGAILVVAMLILPGATASLLSTRLPIVMLLTVIAGAISSLGGLHLAIWLNCTHAGAMCVVALAVFVLTWIFSPSEGLLRRWLQLRRTEPIDPEALTTYTRAPSE